MTFTNTEHDYLAPDIEVVAMAVEEGFAATNVEDPIENETQEW
jgi:hypothetical protein